MARLARVEVFAPDEVAIVHVMNRVVRRCFLLGDDPVTGKNYDHRKQWMEDLLKRFAVSFGIDLLGFAILSNHFHLILRSRPDVVSTWDDTEAARRWLMLCPVRKTSEGLPEEPSESELDGIRNNPQKLAAIRSRLSDIGWWMRLLCQQVATRANRDDRETGKFFQSRFRAVRLLDESALLACAAYVDLNPIRAAMAQTLETSDHTSIQRRIEAMQAESAMQRAVDTSVPTVPAAQIDPDRQMPSATLDLATVQTATVSLDGFLSPIALNEQTGDIGAVPNRSGQRCSDKGFLPISQDEYITLLDWTARQSATGKRGTTPSALRPIFERLSLDVEAWHRLVNSFGRLFYNVAGLPATINAATSRISGKRYYLPGAARELFSSQATASAT